MSKSGYRKQKKKRGCSLGLIVFFLILAATCVLIFSGVLKNMRRDIERQIYPLKYEEEILALSEEYNFTPEFICAVIHTESKFDPNAVSPVGAQGLMQLMPETYDWLCNLRAEKHIPENINIPEENMDYGVYYLRYLTDMYSDKYTACAAYNAGFANVDLWLENPDYSYDGETLYSIPYTETSDYVERIKEAEEIYKRLYFLPEESEN